jgi:hypothetical protein
MHLIAQTYSLLGRRQEGLELNQKAVEFLQRVLPPNHPTISKNGARLMTHATIYCLLRTGRCMVMVPINE